MDFDLDLERDHEMVWKGYFDPDMEGDHVGVWKGCLDLDMKGGHFVFLDQWEDLDQI